VRDLTVAVGITSPRAGATHFETVRSVSKENIMKANIRLAAGLLATGIAAAIAAAPVATAADEPHMVCTYVSEGNSQCETPGNAQLTASPQDVPYPTLYPFLLGGALIFHNSPGHGMR
jgi:hypothetical protein